MPETPEEFYQRAASALRMPPVHEWETWPFDGDMKPRDLLPPAEIDPPREGAGGVGCAACSKPDSDYIWTNDRWRLLTMSKPHGLPAIVLLEPREHFAEPGDLPDDIATDLGRMIVRVERAVRSIDGIGRVHVCRWGDGGEHLHWWFMARPARFPQLLGSFAAIWDDVLPQTPPEIWNDNVAHIVRAMSG